MHLCGRHGMLCEGIDSKFLGALQHQLESVWKKVDVADILNDLRTVFKAAYVVGRFQPYSLMCNFCGSNAASCSISRSGKAALAEP